nr:phage protein Gp36 family protein [uncultured Bacteroides sp.]
MSTFISIDDYDASIHRDILDSITREDTAIVEICEDRAIQEMKSYVSDRYDVIALFPSAPAEGGTDTRNPLVLMMAIDIAVYHLFCIHNPQKMSQIRKDRYDRAVEWLKQIMRGQINIEGATKISAEDIAAKSNFKITSNTKRVNHY